MSSLMRWIWRPVASCCWAMRRATLERLIEPSDKREESEFGTRERLEGMVDMLESEKLESEKRK